MTNQWHVHLVDDLGKDAAMQVAKRNGFSFVSPVSALPCLFRIQTSYLRRLQFSIRTCAISNYKVLHNVALIFTEIQSEI